METPQTKLFKNWWLLAIKGFLILIFGVMVLTLKDFTQLMIIKFFCGIIIVSGALLTFGAFFNKKKKIPWRWWLIEGLYDLIIGVILVYLILKYRMASRAFYTEIIAIWAFVFGLIQIITAFRFKKFSIGWFAMIISGLLAIAYTGLLAVTYTTIIQLKILPGTDAKTTVIGYFTIVLGFIIIFNSEKLRKIHAD